MTHTTGKPFRKSAGFLAPAILACLFVLCANYSEASSWFARVWQANDGLPGDNVTGIEQTEDGFLWLSTQSGLARFDGLKIQEMPIPVGRPRPIIRVTMLDRQQRLWLGEEGGVVVCFTGDNPIILTTADGLMNLLPLSMVEADDGSIWISYVDGSICKIEKSKVTRYLEKDGLAGTGPCYLAADKKGSVWFAKAGRVGVIEDAHFKKLLSLNGRTLQIQSARGGGIWICTGEQILKYSGGEEAVQMPHVSFEGAKVRPTALFEDKSGSLWIGTAASGLFRYDGQSVTKMTTSHDNIRTITEDREGNIWVGTDGGGLNRLRQQVVELLGKETGLPFETVRSAAEDGDELIWAVTQDGKIVRYENGAWETVTSLNGWNGGQATCVVSDNLGGMWIGTRSHGLYLWQSNIFRNVPVGENLSGYGIRSLMVDQKGNLWIGPTSGDEIYSLRGEAAKVFRQSPGSKSVRAMVEDPSGNIWMANMDSKLLKVIGDRLTDETQLTPKPYPPIRCLGSATDGSLLIGYSGNGVGVLRGNQYSRISSDQGLYDDDICSLASDNKGRIWFASDHGIFRIAQDALESYTSGLSAHIESTAYGKDDGLPSLQAYYGFMPGAVKCRDGRILFPTHSGLAVVNPDEVQSVQPLSKVVIERVTLDGKEIGYGLPSETMKFPPDHHRLEVTFTAPSFMAPEKVRFRYRLQGWDEAWVEAGKAHSAVFSRLPSGNYSFKVTACNSAGIWNEAGAGFDFFVTPFFWQTWWFRLSVLLGFTLIVVALVRYLSFRRLRWRLMELERETALQKERARIAKDMHDDLGACLTQISLLGELTRHAIMSQEPAHEKVGQIATMARNGIKSLDAIVWAVNPRNDTFSDLLDFAGQYAVDFLQSAGVRCRIEFPSPAHHFELPSSIRHGVFLVVKEALNNVAKHAAATDVWLRAEITPAFLKLVIKDNGCGFDKTLNVHGSDGLRNMSQRIEDLGGVFNIESIRGSGTTIELIVPIPNEKDTGKSA